MEREIKSGEAARKKVIIAIILVVVAVGIGVGVYLWRKGRLTTGADVEQTQTDESEAAIAKSEWQVGQGLVAYRSGTLVKMENEPAVYLIYRGTKRHIANPQIFERFKFKWENVVIHPVSDKGYLDNYSAGAVIDKFEGNNLPNGLTFKYDDKPAVYSVIEGKLVEYPSPSVFASRHNWNEVSVFNREKFSMDVSRVSFRYRHGTLVRPEGKDEIYWVVGAEKNHIVSPAVFEKMGFKWSNIKIAEHVGDGVTILDLTNPITNQPMYKSGYNIDFPLSDLPGQVSKFSETPTVYFNAFFTSHNERLRFTCPQVFQNRFDWSEIVEFKGGGDQPF